MNFISIFQVKGANISYVDVGTPSIAGLHALCEMFGYLLVRLQPAGERSALTASRDTSDRFGGNYRFGGFPPKSVGAATASRRIGRRHISTPWPLHRLAWKNGERTTSVIAINFRGFLRKNRVISLLAVLCCAHLWLMSRAVALVRYNFFFLIFFCFLLYRFACLLAREPGRTSWTWRARTERC